MSLLKYIMSPFVEFKEEGSKSSKELKTQKKETEESATVPDSQPQPESAAVNTVNIPDASSYSTGSSSAKFTEYEKHFNDLIEEANAKNPVFQGTDFKEFIDSKIDVEAITDEEMKYKTAFNVLKRTGLSKQRLISTGQEYINIIERDLKGFNDAFTQQYKTDVDQKEALLKNKAIELQALNEKITALNKQIKEISHEITQSKDKLNSNKNSFIAAGENKKKELKAELQKIDQYFS